MKPSLKPERIRADQAAAILGINKRTVQLMALRGELPNAAKIGGVWTFDESALCSYIEERIQQPSNKADAHLRRSRGQQTDSFLALSDRRVRQACDEASARLRERARRGR